MSEIHTLGIDLGMSALKLWSKAGGQYLPAVVATNGGRRINQMAGLRTRKPPLLVSVDSVGFYVGSDAHNWGRAVENLSYDRMNGVPETRSLLYGSLTNHIRCYGLFDAPLSILAGLPLEPLSGDAGKQNADAVRIWLEDVHTWEADGQPYQVEVARAEVTAQPSAALFDFVLDDEGCFIPDRKGFLSEEIGIISLGFNTIELLSIENRALIPSMTTGETLGVRRLLELVNTQNLYSLGELDEMLRRGKVNIRSALPVWEREVTGHIEKIWGKRRQRFACILLVGGGTHLLGDALVNHFDGRVIIPDDPVMSISRGLYKQGLNRTGHRRG